MSGLFAWLTGGGGLWAVLGGSAAVVLAALFGVRQSGKKSGENKRLKDHIRRTKDGRDAAFEEGERAKHLSDADIRDRVRRRRNR